MPKVLLPATAATLLGGTVAASGQTTQAPDRYYYGPGMMWNGGWYGWFVGPIFMIFLLAVVVVVAMAVAHLLSGQRAGGGQTGPAPGPTPLDILKERYARGEIDKEEFEERRRTLGE